MAISNPLIDDYTLKGAKGLLVNITGGKDLKLFEVDEVVNKIRSEVEADAEVIIGAITDPSLEGKIRVSIVATSLDGQQPETKSVINMVHRIQNRNPGYSDFTTGNGTASFSFSNASSNPISHGANALKLENEVVSENFSSESIDEVNNQYHEELLKNQEAESIIENTSNEGETSFSEEALSSNDTDTEQESLSDLKEFGVDTDEPDLFSSEIQASDPEDLFNSSNEQNEEDDLEIPAFLRRQKN
jgi:cell division protein FtsZ